MTSYFKFTLEVINTMISRKITNRTKLLLYLYKKGPIPDTFSKSKLAKQIGYKSIGHFYRDFDRLLRDYLIRYDKEKGIYEITKRGELELIPFILMEKFATFFVLIGIAIIAYYIETILGIKVEPELYAAIGTILIVLGVIIHLFLRRTYRKLLPKL